MEKGTRWPIAPRLERRSISIPWSGCRIWLGALTVGGYGLIGSGRDLIYTHRAAWELANGPIPSGLLVCHRCDIRCCINPAHMFLGTHADNRLDCAAKDRDHKGSIHYNAKLTENDVRRIRADPRPSTKIAPEYGVNSRHIRAVKSRLWWRHVAGAEQSDREVA